MRRRLASLLMGTVLALSAGVAGATSAAAAADGPNPNSSHGQCRSAAVGKHLGWAEQANNERRNVGGTCQGPDS
jgi:hypothetical protein